MSANNVVTLIDSNTGEVKERSFTGRTPVVWSVHSDNPGFHGEYDEWEMDALEMALGWVPDLVAAIEKARANGKSIEVRVKEAT